MGSRLKRTFAKNANNPTLKLMMPVQEITKIQIKFKRNSFALNAMAHIQGKYLYVTDVLPDFVNR